MRRRLLLIGISVMGALILTGCVDPEDAYKQKAKLITACKEAGGDWYNTPGWGENCNFDTRVKK